ncbi:hypothetical protein ACFSZS_17805 [Seohaeicola zhoushanensis]
MALAAEAEALAACGADTLSAARQRAQARQADEAAAKLAEQMQRSLAPVGVDALERELASFRETVKGATHAPVRPVEEIAAALEAAETQEAEARGRLASLAAQIGDAREAAAASASALAAARDAHDRAEAAAGPAEDRTARLAALAEAADRARAETATRQAAFDRLAADAPDAATAAANLKRAETAFDNARRRREQLVERRADLSARIDTRAEEGVEERRDEVAGRLAAATERAARFQAEVDALVRLRDALETARAGAREAYFEPVQDELRPLLRILHEDAGIDWETDSIMPGALRRGRDRGLRHALGRDAGADRHSDPAGLCAALRAARAAPADHPGRCAGLFRRRAHREDVHRAEPGGDGAADHRVFLPPAGLCRAGRRAAGHPHGRGRLSPGRILSGRGHAHSAAMAALSPGR